MGGSRNYVRGLNLLLKLIHYLTLILNGVNNRVKILASVFLPNPLLQRTFKHQNRFF